MAASAGIALLGFGASGAPLGVDDYCDVKISAPATIKEMRAMSDGESFSAISDDGLSIETFSYRSGEKTGTLFSTKGIKGDVKIESFDGYEISANGKKILLWTDQHKIYRNSFTAFYYVYDILRSTLTPVSTLGPQRDATISHDGRMVAYMRGNNVFISNIDYKSDKPVTEDGKPDEIIYGSPDWAYEEEFGMVNSFRWNGDDSVLAFMRFDEGEVPLYHFDEYGYYESSNPLGKMYPEAYSYKYPLAGFPNSKVSVKAYNVDNGTVKTMDLPIGEEDYVPSLEFDGEGKNLMVMVLNRDQNELRLYKVNTGSTVSHLVMSERSDTWLAPGAYQMVKYFDRTFVIGSDRSGYRHLYEYDYNGNLLKAISKGEWNVTAYYGSDLKTGEHYVQTTQLGAINRNVACIGKNGVSRMLNPVPGTESGSFSKTFAYWIRKYSTATIPPQFTICNAKGKMIKELEMNREYADKYANAPKMEFLKVPNVQGKEMDACVIKPDGFDPSMSYPLMMYQYNGPGSQTVLNAWKLDGLYYIASRGYVVACVDGRGSGNREREWTTCVYRRLGDLEVEDQLAGARYFSELPYIDSSNTSCFGWSFGGYMTLMEMSAPETQFKAGVAMAAVTDWRFYDSIYTERYMSTPQQNSKGYDAASALLRSQDLKGRLLIMSGTSDDNVHFYNTLRYTSKLNEEGMVFDMMALSGFEHSLRMTNARARLYVKIVDFLNTHLK